MGRWLAIAGLIVAVDQAVKFAVVEYFSSHPPIAVTSFFNLLLVYNTGAAFSFLSDAAGWQRGFFIAIALVACAWIVWLLRKDPRPSLFTVALTLVLAGAVGNMIDRILIGSVVDFLDFHAFGYHWPAFNVADSAITCGAALLLLDAFRPERAHAERARAHADGPGGR
jgi:signal peptidase II